MKEKKGPVAYMNRLNRFLLMTYFTLGVFSIFSGSLLASNHKRVYFNGIFDLTHFGHAGAIQKAIQAAAEKLKVSEEDIDMIVGVTDVPEKNFAAYKRPPIFTVEEKMRSIKSFKGVHEVIRDQDPNMTITAEFLEKHHIDLVVAGADYEDPKKRDLYYKVPYEKGMFTTFGRTEGISTSDIIKRVLENFTEVSKHKIKEGKSNHNLTQAECDKYSQALELLPEIFTKIYK